MEQLNFFSFSVISDRLSNRFMNFWNTIVFWNCIVLSFQKRLNMDFEVASFSPLRIFVRDKCLYLRKEVFPHPCLCDLFSSLKCSQYTHKLWSPIFGTPSASSLNCSVSLQYKLPIIFHVASYMAFHLYWSFIS